MSEKILTLDDFIGLHMLYTYDNTWVYEVYIKNENTMDYRIHSGDVGGRWVRDQEVEIVLLTEGIFKVTWTDATGTDICLNYMPQEKRSHGTIFYPRWVKEHPEYITNYQNDFLEKMDEYRESLPFYPKYVISEFSKIMYMKNVGLNNEDIISKPSYEGMIEDIIEDRLQ